MDNLFLAVVTAFALYFLYKKFFRKDGGCSGGCGGSCDREKK